MAGTDLSGSRENLDCETYEHDALARHAGTVGCTDETLSGTPGW